MSQAWAGNQWDALMLPRIGQEVIVSFLNGDPDRPLVTGALYNGTHQAPYSLPANKTRTTLKSQSSPGGGGYNELRMDDKKGSEQLFVHGQKDVDLYVKNDRMESIDHDRHRIVAAAAFEKIGNDHSRKITANHNLKVAKTLSQAVGGNVNQKTGQNWLEKAGVDYSLKAGTSVVLDAGMSITLKGGGTIALDPSGVSITGSQVRINSGGSAGSAKGASPTAPQPPKPLARVQNANGAMATKVYNPERIEQLLSGRGLGGQMSRHNGVRTEAAALKEMDVTAQDTVVDVSGLEREQKLDAVFNETGYYLSDDTAEAVVAAVDSGDNLLVITDAVNEGTANAQAFIASQPEVKAYRDNLEAAIQDPEGSAYGGGPGYIGGLAEGERLVSNILTVNGDKMPAGLKDASAQDLMIDAAGLALSGAPAVGMMRGVGKVVPDSNVLRQTGGSSGYIDPADELYDAIRASEADVSAIAANTGIKPQNIQKVKDHVFYNEHVLDRYVHLGEPAEIGRFHSNMNQAEAWKRFETGTHTDADMTWLKHETAERWYELKYNSGYTEAHDRVDHRWSGNPWGADQ